MKLGQGTIGWRELLAALVPALAAGVMTAWTLSGFLYEKSSLPWLLISLAIPATSPSRSICMRQSPQTDARRCG